MQVNSYLLIPSSPGSSSTPLTLYNTAFYPPHGGVEGLSLHMTKPPQSIGATPSLSLNFWFLIRSINAWSHIHLSIRIYV